MSDPTDRLPQSEPLQALRCAARLQRQLGEIRSGERSASNLELDDVAQLVEFCIKGAGSTSPELAPRRRVAIPRSTLLAIECARGAVYQILEQLSHDSRSNHDPLPPTDAIWLLGNCQWPVAPPHLAAAAARVVSPIAVFETTVEEVFEGPGAEFERQRLESANPPSTPTLRWNFSPQSRALVREARDRAITAALLRVDTDHPAISSPACIVPVSVLEHVEVQRENLLRGISGMNPEIREAMSLATFDIWHVSRAAWPDAPMIPLGPSQDE